MICFFFGHKWKNFGEYVEGKRDIYGRFCHDVEESYMQQECMRCGKQRYVPWVAQGWITTWKMEEPKAIVFNPDAEVRLLENNNG